MVINRVAEVFAKEDGAKEGIRGSGYLISPRLVLTAWHVIQNSIQGGICKARFFKENGQQTDWSFPEVVWFSEDLDAALLSPCDQGHFPQEATPVQWGELAGKDLVPVEAVGFGEAMTNEAGQTDTFPIYGLCSPQDSIKSARMHINVTWAAPKEAKNWRGESGAAVFAGEMLMGLVVEVPGAFDPHVLQAIPAKALLSNADFCARCTEDGISPELHRINAVYVSSHPDIDWDAVQEEYVVKTLESTCRFEFTGLSVEGVTEHCSLTPENAYGGMRFRFGSDQDRLLGLKDLLDLPAVVLLGLPGMGKSGSLKMLIYYAAQEKRVVPILLPLSSLADRTDISAAGIVESIAEQAASDRLVPEATEQFFWRMLSQGRCHVFFDALDELANRAQREKVVLAIRELSDRAPGNRFLLTSRPAEYRETPIPSNSKDGVPFRQVEIVDLDSSQMREYLRVWFDDEEIAERIIGRTELMEMHPGPLLLNLMGHLAQGSELPLDKFTLYDEFINTALNSWEEKKGVDESTPPSRIRRDALEKLAWTAQEGKTLLEGTAIDTLSDIRENQDPAKVLNWLARRSGILRRDKQVGERATRISYQFTHQQLQEFLAGCELAKRLSADFDKSFESVARHIYDEYWDQTLHFAVVSLQQSFEKHNDFILKVLTTSRPEDEQSMWLEFGSPEMRAAALLGECDPKFVSPMVAEEVTDRLVNLWIAQTGYEASKCFEEILALAERDFVPALHILEQIALEDTNLPPGLEILDGWRMDAVWMLSRKGAESAPESINRTVNKTTDVKDRIRLAKCWAMLAHPEEARELMVGDFNRNLGMNQVENFCFLNLLRGLTDLGFAEVGASLAKGQRVQASSNLLLKLECSLWLHEQGEIASGDLFKLASDTLQYMPREEKYMDDALDAAIRLAIQLWKTDKGGALSLLCQSLTHPRYAWPYVMDFSLLDDDIGESARKGLDMVISEAKDCSRRRGMISSIIQDENNERAIPRLLHLLENDWALRWEGDQIINSLMARGRELEAAAALNGIATDSERGSEYRQKARDLLLVCS